MSVCVITFRITVASQIALLGRPFTDDERKLLETSAGEHMTGYNSYPVILSDTVEEFLGVHPANVEVVGEKSNVYGGNDLRPVIEDNSESDSE